VISNEGERRGTFDCEREINNDGQQGKPIDWYVFKLWGLFFIVLLLLLSICVCFCISIIIIIRCTTVAFRIRVVFFARSAFVVLAGKLTTTVYCYFCPLHHPSIRFHQWWYISFIFTSISTWIQSRSCQSPVMPRLSAVLIVHARVVAYQSKYKSF